MVACAGRMNSADYVAGCAALSVTVVPWVFASRRVSRRLLPEWTGAAGALVAAVVGVSGVLVAAEALGLVGLFSRWLMAVASALVAAVAAALADRRTPVGVPAARPDRATTGTQRAALLLAAFCVLGVSAALLGSDARILHTGPYEADSLHYHLTQSAYFVQSHDIDHLHQTASSDTSVYYPFDDELLDAVAMFGPRPDIAILPLNLGFAWLALLACWVIGARWAMAPAALAAGSAVLALPLLAGVSSGPGLNDIPTLAALLAAIAVATHAGGRQHRWLAACSIAGLALGLAGGSKLSSLPPVLVVALTVVVIAPVRRAVTAGVVAAAALLTGGFWFVRDWIAVGTPVPSVNLTVAGHGLHGVPYPEVRPDAFTVAHYLTNGSVIRHFFIPGLKVIFTPLWPLVIALALVGVVLALVRSGDPLRRMLALTVLFGAAVYLVTPTTALGPPDQPILFATNVRYAIPAIGLAIVLVATAEPLRRFTTAVTAAFTVLTFALLESSTTSLRIDRSTGWAAAVVIAAALAWVVVVLQRRPSHLVVAGMIAAGLVVVVGAGADAQRHYLRLRYSLSDPFDRLFAWGDTVSGQRIGVVGRPLLYPFFGPMIDNHVAYVGVAAPDRSFGAPATCSGWRSALAAGRYGYVVIEAWVPEHTTELLAWTTSLPGARVVFRNAIGTVLSLPDSVNTSGC
jgi:hypothetical protein